MSKITINATHIGQNINGIGRFSLSIVKAFLGKCQIFINKKAVGHFSEDELKYLKVVSKDISPDYGFIGHIKRLIYTNSIKGSMLNLSQLEISFWNKEQIIVVLDLIPLLFPNFHKKQYLFFKYLLPYILKYKTKKIITISYHTKELLVEKYKINENKIEVIHNGIKIPIFKNVKKEKYILFVGRNSPTKNIDNIVKTFLELKKNEKYKDYKLYLVGFEKDYMDENINTLGYVDDDELDMLYRKATIFFFPTLYEGFGYPVIEAMARKTVVLTSNNSSIPELANDNAIYCDPYDVNDMLKKLKYIIDHDNLRKNLEEKAFKEVVRFDIKNMIEAYQKILL